LSGNLVLIVNRTGNCYGESHIEHVIPEVLHRGAIRCRVAACLQDDEWVLTGQDKAGGHYHDNCSVAKTTGLNPRRKEAYKRYKLVNHLYDLCGTPEQCANDHLHQVLKHRVHKEVESLCGKVKDNTELPDLVSGGMGGPLLSTKGYKRGTHLFLLALAMSRVWSAMRQEVLLATLVRTGYYTKERALQLAHLTQAQLDSGIDELELGLKLSSASGSNHARHDHTGQDPVNKYLCRNTFGDLPLKSSQDKQAEAIAGRAADLVLEQELAKMKPVLFTELPGMRMPTKAELNEPIVPVEKTRSGALNHLIARPDCTNAAHLPNFKRLFYNLFAKIERVAKRPPAYLEHLMGFQLFLLKRRFLELRKAGVQSVVDKDLHGYVWHAMKTAHNANPIGRDELLRHMIGDMRMYSLTPTGRQDKTEEGRKGKRKDKTDNLEDDAFSNEEM
jgi:hypothetical protein